MTPVIRITIDSANQGTDHKPEGANMDQELIDMAHEYDRLMKDALYLCECGHEVENEEDLCIDCQWETK